MTPSTLITLGILAGILIIAVLVIGGMYNALVKLRNKFENAWAQIDVQLERRFDLIPDLVETVKGYMKHEKETLDTVIMARNTAVQARKNTSSNIGDQWPCTHIYTYIHIYIC